MFAHQNQGIVPCLHLMPSPTARCGSVNMQIRGDSIYHHNPYGSFFDVFTPTQCKAPIARITFNYQPLSWFLNDYSCVRPSPAPSLRIGGINPDVVASVLAHLIFDLCGVRLLAATVFGKSGICRAWCENQDDCERVRLALDGRLWMSPLAGEYFLMPLTKEATRFLDGIMLQLRRSRKDVKFPRHYTSAVYWQE